MNWKLIYWLNIAPELFSKDGDNNKNNKDPLKPTGGLLDKIVEFGGDLPNKINNNKNPLMKGAVLIGTIAIGYFVFFHGKITSINIKSIDSGDQGNNIKITAVEGDKSYTVPTINFEKHTYSEPQNTNVYKIFLKSHEGLISFNVNAHSVSTANANINNNYQLDNGFQINWPGTTVAGSACNCSSTGSTCNCSSTGSACTCSAGSSSNCCCCCCLAKLINFAIMHPNNGAKITFSSVFLTLLPIIFYLAVFLFIMKFTMKNQGLYGKNSIFKIGNSISQSNKSNVTFKNVAGLEEEKEELKEIVDYLKYPKKYQSVGARTPKGVIFYGPPGTGKTLLAKAVSGEADVPFIEASGASFDDMFVGVGAKRVRELFEKAKQLAPCIIFIDEIDALASKRSNKYSMGGGSGDQTINQLLSELDGFNTKDGIVVIAATNRLQSIDEAVLRPGRFDRHVMVNLPGIKDRIQILKLHAANKNISVSVDLEDVARKTPGFSGAQLENVMNEAAILSVRHRKKIIGIAEISEGIDRVMSGPAKKSNKMSEEERTKVAYHEAGHAIAGIYAREGDVVEKITIIPRGKAAGYILSAPEKEETFLYTKQQYFSILITTLAGRASEEIFFGEEQITSGAANDLYKATGIASAMVTKLGMSKDVGLVQYSPTENDENPYKNTYSESTGKLIDQEIKNILDMQYQAAKAIISAHKDELLLIVETLLLVETIDKKDIYHIHEHQELPPMAKKVKEQLRLLKDQRSQAELEELIKAKKEKQANDKQKPV